MWTSPRAGCASASVSGPPALSVIWGESGPLSSRAALRWNTLAPPSAAMDQRMRAAGSAEAVMSTSTALVLGLGVRLIEMRAEAALSGFCAGAAVAVGGAVEEAGAASAGASGHLGALLHATVSAA